jgi:hypothetical protein
MKTIHIFLGLLALAGTLLALTETSARAYVVGVDAKARAITLRHPTQDGKGWKETVAHWTDATEWARSDKEIWDIKPATAALAGQLAKDAKVYVVLRDEGDGKLILKSLRTIPAGEKVE